MKDDTVQSLLDLLEGKEEQTENYYLPTYDELYEKCTKKTKDYDKLFKYATNLLEDSRDMLKKWEEADLVLDKLMQEQIDKNAELEKNIVQKDHLIRDLWNKCEDIKTDCQNCNKIAELKKQIGFYEDDLEKADAKIKDLLSRVTDCQDCGFLKECEDCDLLNGCEDCDICDDCDERGSTTIIYNYYNCPTVDWTWGGVVTV